MGEGARGGASSSARRRRGCSAGRRLLLAEQLRPRPSSSSSAAEQSDQRERPVQSARAVGSGQRAVGGARAVSGRAGGRHAGTQARRLAALKQRGMGVDAGPAGLACAIFRTPARAAPSPRRSRCAALHPHWSARRRPATDLSAINAASVLFALHRKRPRTLLTLRTGSLRSRPSAAASCSWTRITPARRAPTQAAPFLAITPHTHPSPSSPPYPVSGRPPPPTFNISARRCPAQRLLSSPASLVLLAPSPPTGTPVLLSPQLSSSSSSLARYFVQLAGCAAASRSFGRLSNRDLVSQ